MCPFPQESRSSRFCPRVHPAITPARQFMNVETLPHPSQAVATSLGGRAGKSWGVVEQRDTARADAAAAMRSREPLRRDLLANVVSRLDHGELRDALAQTLDELTRLLGYLNLIEADLTEGKAPAETMPVFMLIEGEARAVLCSFETQAERADWPAAFREALSATGWAVKHELQRVYGGLSLSPVRDSVGARDVRAEAEHARGILCNCLQQAVVALARVFDRTLDVADLFEDFRIRRQQSLRLYEDLKGLIRLARLAEQQRDLPSVNRLIFSLGDFSRGSMRYLMFKDWKPCEQMINATREALHADALPGAINQLGCYLETMLSQVRLRAVLADCDLA